MLLAVQAQQFLLVPSIVGLTHDFIGDGWSQVLAMFVHNAADLLGRGPLATRCPCPLAYVWPAVVVRCALGGAICLCIRPYVLSATPAPLLLLLAAFGASTGYLSTSVIGTAAGRVSAKDREATGYLGILSIFAGLQLGSALAFPLKALVAPEIVINPR